MAYSVEHEGNETEVVILDTTGDDLDVNLIFLDGVVYLKQVHPDSGKTDLIIMTNDMFSNMIKAYNSPEGVFA